MDLKEYMLVLQKRYGGQEAVEFINQSQTRKREIIPFSDTDGKRSIKKETLQFYDIITNQFRNLFYFLDYYGLNKGPTEYNERTSYLGFKKNKYMRRVRLSFGDERLLAIAHTVSNNHVNIMDDTVYEELSEMIALIESLDSTYVDYILQKSSMGSNRSILPKSFLDTLNGYYCMATRINLCKENNLSPDPELTFDLNYFKGNFEKEVLRYRNFRELYLLKKDYLQLVASKKNNQEQAIPSKNKIKEKKMELPGQTSFFD